MFCLVSQYASGSVHGRNSYIRCQDCPSVLPRPLLGKSVSKRIGSFIFSFKFPFKIGLYLYKCTIYDLAWNSVFMSGLVIQIATSICQLCYRNVFVGLLVLELPLLWIPLPPVIIELVLVPYSSWRSICYSNMLHCCVTILRCYKNVSFFPRTARIWYLLPIEYFPLTYDLNEFKTRVSYL